MNRRTALSVAEYQQFGGTFFDSYSHAAMFRDEKPFQFGVKTSRLFSSEFMGEMVNKKWTWHTMAKGNFYTIPGGKDEYEWEVVGDALIEYRVTGFLETAGSQIGKGGDKTFRIVLNHPHVENPMVLKTEDDNAPLIKVVSVGTPETMGPYQYVITCKLQTSDPNAYIDSSLIDEGATLIRVSSQVGDEDNPFYAGDEYGKMAKLRGVVGQVANKVEFSDKFVRMEISAARKGQNNNAPYKMGGATYKDGGFHSGYIYQSNITKKGSNETIPAGFFISKAEARLLDRSEMDREFMMEFGNLEISTEPNTGHPIKTAPGWRQIVRDGQYFPHDGSWTLNELYDFLHQIFVTRRGFMNRKPYMIGGTGFISYLSNLIAAEASVFQTVEPGLFIRENKEPIGVHPNELEYGAQFTKIKLPMGIVVTVMYDPIKDDPQIYRETAPGSYLPIESFSCDILEFGKTESAAQGATGENITMVCQDMVDEYYHVSNVYDIRRGPITDGGNAYSNNKKTGIYRTMCGSLAVWDTKAIGRMEWVV